LHIVYKVIDFFTVVDYHSSSFRQGGTAMQRLITSKELADYLGVAHQTIRIWVSQKKIPYTKLGAAVRFSPEQIDSILEQGKREALGNAK
jgi:excisionase family DNA binding protein